MKSNFKLVLAGRQAEPGADFLKKLNAYTFKEDVIVKSKLQEAEFANLLAASYASICHSAKGAGLSVLEAFKAKVPVITLPEPYCEEVAQAAALYCAANDHTRLSEQMMLLYKDEKLREELVFRSTEIGKEYTQEKAADRLWMIIQEAIG